MVFHIHALPEGYQLQEYTISRTLGFGGFGITYFAFDNNLQKHVAIKEYLPAELAVRLVDQTVVAKSESDSENFSWGLDQFLTEARTVARFEHPNIVRIYRFFKQNGTGYFVMDYVDGSPLSAIIQSDGALSRKRIEQWLFPIIDGLSGVHEAGYLHRDIKPHNLIIRKDESPVLIDFGSARLAIGHRTALTRIYTPKFAPIEQIAQNMGEQGPWTDIYALAATAYVCLAGKHPQEAQSRLYKDTQPSAIEMCGSSFPAHFLNAIDKGLEVRPENRPRSLVEWRRLLSDPDSAPTRIISGPIDVPLATEAHQTLMQPLIPLAKSNSLYPLFYKHKRIIAGVTAGIAILLLTGALLQNWMKTSQPSLSVESQQTTTQATSHHLQPGKILDDLDLEDRKSTAQEISQFSPSTGVPPETNQLTDIEILSDPPGAQVFWNDRYVGETPTTLNAVEHADENTIKLELEGYQPVERVVTELNTKDDELFIKLSRRILKFALNIQPTPADSNVKILNITTKYNPGMMLEKGQYSIHASKPGYISKTQTVELSDQSVNFAIVLEAEKLEFALGTLFRDCATCPEMVAIPAGTFQMGSASHENGHSGNELPVHGVRIDRSFAMGLREVTFNEYDVFVASTGRKSPKDKKWGRGNQPVINVNWGDAKAYVDWLSRRTGKAYRLPSESEWEYAARAGSTSRYWWGNEIGLNRANCNGCGSQWDGKQPGPTGSFTANPFGLYDMNGNVWEWIEDCWHDNYINAPTDGSAWVSSHNCSQRVLRGGSWLFHSGFLRSALRGRFAPAESNSDIGFRVARDLDR